MEKGYDSHQLSRNLVNAFNTYHNALNEVALNSQGLLQGEPDPFHLYESVQKVMYEVCMNPAKTIEHGFELFNGYMQLMNNFTQKVNGQETNATPKKKIKDNRFGDKAWEENPFFNFIKQAYYLNANWLQDVVHDITSLDKKEAHKLEFFVKQFIDAMSPTNFPCSNPQVIRETLTTNGENLLHGAEHFLSDALKSKGHFAISTADFKAFEVGKNLAITPGKVVYQNDLIQLIQYTPLTDKVYQTPLIMMPAWINKFYILDLKPQNSFVKWALEQGYTVFMISWRNPDHTLKNKGFEDYMKEGPLSALKVVQDITGEKQVNFLGYCLGGTLLACTISYLKAKQEKSIKSATFLTTLIDFEKCGDLEVFMDEEQISSLEQRMSERGYLEGYEMAKTFNMLRANDMIWSFYVNNYLLGKEPFPFDILYWNSDSTRLPSKMHSFYLRNMYQDNALIQKKGISLCGQNIDLHKIDIPTYILATREDHIAPWKAAYQATQVYKGQVKFVLSGSGHVAGVVNHPSKNKYNHWVNDQYHKNPDKWLSGTKEVEGSWWIDWNNWLKVQSGKKVNARDINSKQIIEEAPGSFVKQRI